MIEWCADAGIDVEQRPTPMGDLGAAEEIFLTSSTRDVHPVDAVIDDTGAQIWASRAQTLTSAAADAFATRSAAQWNP